MNLRTATLLVLGASAFATGLSLYHHNGVGFLGGCAICLLCWMILD